MNKMQEVQIPEKDWQKLFKLIPRIEKAKPFGRTVGMKKQADGSYTFPYTINSKVVDDFLKVVFELGIIIPFEWPQWREGARLLKNSKTDFGKLSEITLCKLLTVIVRSDRFIEGNLVSNFESGTVLKILKALREKIEKK